MSLSFVSNFSRALPPLTPIGRTCGRRARFYASATPESVRAKIASESIMVFSTTWCPFCAQVKSLFDSLSVDYASWELDQMDDGSYVRQILAEETGQTSVPNVFVGGKHVGGCDDTFALHAEGKLLDMIKAASA